MYINSSPERITIKGYVRDDCACIAIGNALGISYDLARKILQVGIYYAGEFKFAKSKPRTKLQFTQKSHVKRICEALSVDRIAYAKYDSETNKHISNTTLTEVAQELTDGIYIVLVKGHLTTIINGKIVDTWNSGELKAEMAYKIDVSYARNVISELAKFYRMSSSKHMVENHVGKILN